MQRKSRVSQLTLLIRFVPTGACDSQKKSRIGRLIRTCPLAWRPWSRGSAVHANLNPRARRYLHHGNQQPLTTGAPTFAGMIVEPLTVAAVYENPQALGLGALATVIVVLPPRPAAVPPTIL